MKSVKQWVLWGISLGLATLYFAAIWACDFNFGVSVNGKGVKATSIAGSAEQIEAQIRAGGKKCKGKIHVGLNVGDNGCVIVAGTLCGENFNVKICNLQPGSRFDYDIEVDGGGMVAIQVPQSLAFVSAPTFRNTAGTDSATLTYSDTPFGRLLEQPFAVQPGKKVIYAKWPAGFEDSLIDGTINTLFTSAAAGLDTIKFVLMGELHVFLLGSTIPAPIGFDSVVVFAEGPHTYDFARVTPPAAIPVHSVFGRWYLLSDATATSYGLSNVSSTSYILLKPFGAASSEVDTAYTLTAGGRSVAGRFVKSLPSTDTANVIIRFDRSTFTYVVDTLRHTINATLSGTTTTTSYPTTFALIETLQAQLGVKTFDHYITRFELMPNPARSKTMLSYDLAEGANVSITLVDETGATARALTSKRETAGHHELEISGVGLSAGVYFVQCKVIAANGEATHAEKLVISR